MHNYSNNFSYQLSPVILERVHDWFEPKLISSFRSSDLDDYIDFQLSKMKILVDDEYISMPENLMEPQEILNWLKGVR
ncbi:hypothetical protein DK080_16960 [Salmonella enterica subsp. enterica serovar Poona]|nr:hypothetical protein [Salmonella enterica subsp. enterica serovar Poona]ECA2557632.1 hypothetical protein [Salmonella enterica subsp. enterica serovar Poona]